MHRVDLLHLYVDPQPNGGALNMAIDEALLESTAAISLRFYRWTGPSVSIGYFSKFADVEQYEVQPDIVRRWTGGGIVPHGEDITYSVIVPAKHEFFLQSSAEIYATLHEGIRHVLSTNGIPATLAGAASPSISDACFANAVRADVLFEGKKIAGAAQRRTRAGLLHQGSLQLGLPREPFHAEFANTLSASVERKELQAETLARAHLLVRDKYGTSAWLRRR